MICRKCHKSGTITIKKEYTYCDICYMVYLNHKFRACIGKSKVVTPNEKILIGLSGGLGSTALLDLIHTGITLNTHKKLRLEPQFVHLTGGGERNDKVANTIVEQCKIYGIDVQICNISNYISNDITTTPIITSNDFISRIILNVLASVAKELKCRLIFTAEPATSLAAKLLTDIVIGRGSQIENDIGFTDNRYKGIKILRPLRDITTEELYHYIKIKGLLPAYSRNKVNNLQSVIDSFVSTLEKESPATISTICKTANKIGSNDSQENNDSCMFCKGKLDKIANKLTAIQATIFSRMVSYTNEQHKVQMEHIEYADQEEMGDQSMFPFLQQHLCYCCSRSYAEMADVELQKHIQGLIIDK